MKFFRGSRVRQLSELVPSSMKSSELTHILPDTGSRLTGAFIKKTIAVCSMILVVGLVFNISDVSVPTKCTDTNRAQHCIDKYYVLDVLRGHHTGLDLVEELKLAGVIVEESRRYKIEPALILALIETESKIGRAHV